MQTLEASTADRYARKGEKLRRFKTFSYGARSYERATRHCPRQGRPFGTRYPLHREQSDGLTQQEPLRETLLCASASPEPHQELEEPSRLRPDVVHARQRKPDTAHVARMRILAVVESARGLPKALPVAACSVRHAAPPFGQTGRNHRRKENPDRHDAASFSPRQNLITLLFDALAPPKTA